MAAFVHSPAFRPPSSYTNSFTNIRRPIFLRPREPLRYVCTHQRGANISMSGVNGGIDYDIDLTALPPDLAARISYIQSGPDSPVALIEAAETISAATPEHPQTLPVLVDVLGFNNPIAADIAVRALAAAGSAAIPPLLTGVAAFNYAVNAYALRALARIGDPAIVDVAIACAARGPIPNVRRAACNALGALQFEISHDAEQAFKCLLKLADSEPDWGVRYAAVAALQQFVALKLIDPLLREDAVCVVSATARGDSRVATQVGHIGEETKTEMDSQNATEDKDVESADSDEDSLVVDPAVMARAAVALETLAPRVEALIGS